MWIARIVRVLKYIYNINIDTYNIFFLCFSKKQKVFFLTKLPNKQRFEISVFCRNVKLYSVRTESDVYGRIVYEYRNRYRLFVCY